MITLGQHTVGLIGEMNSSREEPASLETWDQLNLEATMAYGRFIGAARASLRAS